ncbi:MAG TPA: CbiX/SirB N-terminal domain-containing protein [Casimicrobiaceae bacterium]|nr:CbiX/SirB N-terminal domain-containing protein [Casimicrobiaceae bacterium]
MSRRDGVILYAHGARDPRWAEPFVRLRERVAARSPERVVAIAFLEHLQPDLAAAVRQLSAQGVTHVRVVPMFFGRGGHLRDDLPRQLEAARGAAPGVALEVTMAAGESDDVLDALADFALTGPLATDSSI